MQRLNVITPVVLALGLSSAFAHERDFPIAEVDQEAVGACHYFLNEVIEPKYDGVLLVSFLTSPRATLGLERYLKLTWLSVGIATSKIELLGNSAGEDRAFNASVECLVDLEERRVLRLRFGRGLGVGDAITHGQQTEVLEFVYPDFESDSTSHRGKY